MTPFLEERVIDVLETDLGERIQQLSDERPSHIVMPAIQKTTEDIAKLLLVLNRLVEQGNTVLVIEHNLDVIKSADHLIDLGPEGGDGGGTILAIGTPEEVAAVDESYTGQYLKRVL